MSVSKKLFDLLSPKEKTFVLFLMILIMAILDMIGVVSISLHWIIDQPRASRKI